MPTISKYSQKTVLQLLLQNRPLLDPSLRSWWSLITLYSSRSATTAFAPLSILTTCRPPWRKWRVLPDEPKTLLSSKCQWSLLNRQILPIVRQESCNKQSTSKATTVIPCQPFEICGQFHVRSTIRDQNQNSVFLVMNDIFDKLPAKCTGSNIKPHRIWKQQNS